MEIYLASTPGGTTQSASLKKRGSQLNLGACPLRGGGVRFRVWAPGAQEVSVKIWADGQVRESCLTKDEWGYFEGTVREAKADDRYLYRVDGQDEHADPASRFQPEGVQGPSQVVDPAAFAWGDRAWSGLAIDEFVIYEVHTGTFSEEGTFAAIVSRLAYLKELGVTAVELMPVAQFPGRRNWGYDGVFPYAPQHSYGGPQGLKELINACHEEEIAVVLDVVYNHLGPEGNHFGSFGPYFTERYRTPWGNAINFDGPFSDGVRDFFINNAIYWVTEYHVDALRIDAIHGIFDFGARHFLCELAEAVHDHARQFGRKVYVIGESDLNDVRVIKPTRLGGFGLDAQWNDDFHHALHTLLTGERDGYYQDFGRVDQLAKSLKAGFVYSGQYSNYRKRRHRNSSAGRPSRQFVVFSQNHDQIGNRPLGDRLAASQPLEKLKLAAGMVLLSPFIPLLFMGEEYGETAPFLYFVSHSDVALIEAVTKGRHEQFPCTDGQGAVPDPLSESTFAASRIDPEERRQGSHRVLFEFYRELLRLRKALLPPGGSGRKPVEVKVYGRDRAILTERRGGEAASFCLFSFNAKNVTLHPSVCRGVWNKIMESSEHRWGGPGSTAPDTLVASVDSEMALNLRANSFVVYRMKGDRES